MSPSHKDLHPVTQPSYKVCKVASVLVIVGLQSNKQPLNVPLSKYLIPRGDLMWIIILNTKTCGATGNLDLLNPNVDTAGLSAA